MNVYAIVNQWDGGQLRFSEDDAAEEFWSAFRSGRYRSGWLVVDGVMQQFFTPASYEHTEGAEQWLSEQQPDKQIL